MVQTTLIFWHFDTPDDVLISGVHEKEIEWTEELCSYMTFYGGFEANFFVDPDRTTLIKLYTEPDQKINFVYDTALWSMDEEEAYMYCKENDIGLIIFYPKDLNIEWFRQGDIRTFYEPSSASGITYKELARICNEELFLYELYKKDQLKYFDNVMQRKIYTDRKIYVFRAVKPKKTIDHQDKI